LINNRNSINIINCPLSIIHCQLSLLFLFFFHLTISSPAQNILSEPLKFGWAGGLNSSQFCEMDLNLDGVDDLLIFDRHGNRKLTFLNGGTPNKVDYIFKPELAGLLPDLHDWVFTADYNGDGKMDIFTYSLGGARVFKNISESSLKFELVTDLLTSYYYSGKVGILMTDVDYPAFADIDNDGDLDVLTFFGLGSFVEYHKNLSMEKYGNCDSLDYRLTDHCWGKFKESEGGNKITLNADCPFIDADQKQGNPKHTGSTMLATDLNGDGLKDLVLGDVDYPNLIALTNSGTVDSAFMTAQDTAFPSNSLPVQLFSFPVASFLDLDNDGLKDMVVSPFDPGLVTSDNYRSAWFYKNTGSNDYPQFELQTERLFQEEMLDFGSNAYPLLYDFNLDGLMDLFVGNYGYYDSSYYHQAVLHSVYSSKIACYKNIGTSGLPLFQLITNDLAGISSLHLTGIYPSLGDLTGDGKPDLLTGNSDGSLIFFQCTGEEGGIPVFGPPQLKYQNIDVGEFSTPQLFDLNRDGLPDLIIGERAGNLNYYRNDGSSGAPVFTLITDRLGKVNVTDSAQSYDGYSTPFFFQGQDQKTNLIVGCEEGKLHYFTGIDNNLDGKFREPDSLSFLVGTIPSFPGWRSSATIAHLSSQAHHDLITGNFSGGLNYCSSHINPGVEEFPRTHSIKLSIYPNPADEWTILELHPASGIRHPAIDILNLPGKTIFQHPGKSSLRVSTALFPDGIYLVRCGSTTSKLIIRHR